MDTVQLKGNAAKKGQYRVAEPEFHQNQHCQQHKGAARSPEQRKDYSAVPNRFQSRGVEEQKTGQTNRQY